MAWPTLQDYNEAMQSPAVVFSDSELRQAKPETTRLGLPKCVTGNFACVYQFSSGGKEWAVRCFHREVPDQRERYAHISRTLNDLGLRYTVPFEFLDDGMRIRGRWYPLLKMQWVRGPLLTTYIEQNIKRPGALKRLAKRWTDMLAALRDAGIAHGDLQHGNVLVVADDLRLVDYDGMYVPSLAGRVSHETGHPNYQHPRRTGSDFGPECDNFSAWVIYVSLLGLAAEPELWNEPGVGDEALLFRKQEFANPDGSAMLARLKGSKDAELSRLAKRFDEILRLPLAQVPSLDGIKPAAKAQKAPLAAKPRKKPGVKPAWVTQPAPRAGTPAPTEKPPAALWRRLISGTFRCSWWTLKLIFRLTVFLVVVFTWKLPKSVFVLGRGAYRRIPPRHRGKVLAGGGVAAIGSVAALYYLGYLTFLFTLWPRAGEAEPKEAGDGKTSTNSEDHSPQPQLKPRPPPSLTPRPQLTPKPSLKSKPPLTGQEAEAHYKELLAQLKARKKDHEGNVDILRDAIRRLAETKYAAKLTKPLYNESIAAAKQFDNDPAAKIRVLETAYGEFERLNLEKTRRARRLKTLIDSAKLELDRKMAP